MTYPPEREMYVTSSGTLQRDDPSSIPPLQSVMRSHGTLQTLAVVWISEF